MRSVFHATAAALLCAAVTAFLAGCTTGSDARTPPAERKSLEAPTTLPDPYKHPPR